MKLPNNLSYEDLGHDAYKFPAFSPDYVLEDIGENYDLTVTLFGYQLDNEAVSKLIQSLNEHLIISLIHETLRMKNETK